MHMSYSALGIARVIVKYVGCATIGSESSVDWKIKILDAPILPKNLIEMLLVDVLGETFNHDFCALGRRGASPISIVTLTSSAAPAAASTVTLAATTASVATVTTLWG